MNWRRAGAAAAYVAAALHAAAAAALLLVLRHGLPPVADEHRLQFMQSHRVAWIASWSVWQLTAISLVVFYWRLARRMGVLGVPRRKSAALLIVVGAALIDVLAEALFAWVLPNREAGEFVRLDRNLEILLGGVANGLYTIALALVAPSLPRRLTLVALPVIVSGLALTYGSLAHQPAISVAASAVLFPLFIFWLVLAGRWLRQSE